MHYAGSCIRSHEARDDCGLDVRNGFKDRYGCWLAVGWGREIMETRVPGWQPASPSLVFIVAEQDSKKESNSAAEAHGSANTISTPRSRSKQITRPT